MQDKVYTVQEAFKILNKYNVVTNIEVLRRWLRQGKIEGTEPITRKSGWTITQDAIDKCLREHVPAADYERAFNTTHTDNTVALDEDVIRQDARSAMWWELVHKYIFENYIPIKKQHLKDAAEHRKYSNELVEIVWKRITTYSSERGYKQPRIPYLLDAFLFEGQRLLLDNSFANKHEQAVYAIFEYVLDNK